MSANKKLLILPGDGIGPEVMRQVRRVLDWLDRRRNVTFDDRGRAGRRRRHRRARRARSATRRWPTRERRRGAVRRGRRPEVGQLGFDKRPERGLCGCARSWACSPTCGRRLVFDALVDASTLKPEVVRGLDIMIVRELTGGIYFGEPRGIEDTARRRAPRLRHPGLHHERDPAHRPRRLRAGAQAQNKLLLGRQGQRDGVRPALARGRDEAAQGRISRRRAGAHVRRQLRHAAGAQAEAVRRDRHRQHVRRHPVRRGGDADRLARHAAVGLAGRAGRDTAAAGRCTSRSTARRPTSPARASPTRWRRCSASP